MRLVRIVDKGKNIHHKIYEYFIADGELPIPVEYQEVFTVTFNVKVPNNIIPDNPIGFYKATGITPPQPNPTPKPMVPNFANWVTTTTWKPFINQMMQAEVQGIVPEAIPEEGFVGDWGTVNNPILDKLITKYEKDKGMQKVKEVDMNKVKLTDFFKYKPLQRYNGLIGKIPVRAGTTFVGVEIELEQVETKCDTPNTWTSTEDGSLKDGGIEFVTRPIQFKYLEIELVRLFDSLRHYKTSQRCSVHVHLNARDFTLNELRTFILLYTIFERSFYKFSGGRNDNNFCVPLEYYPELVKDFLQGLEDRNRVYEKWFKYYGFNLSPIFGGESSAIGTIEFRHMKGTTDVPTIINWINLIVSLKISAKKIPYTEIVEHIRTMNTTSGYYWLANVVFKDYFNLINTPTFKEDVEYGISTAKFFLFKKEECYIELDIVR